MKALIEAGADVNARDEYSRTPLDIASQWSLKLEVFKVLVSAGAGASHAPTALHSLLNYNHPSEVDVSQVELLIDAGADVNAKDPSGRTPLQIAAERGHSADVLRLLQPR